MIKEILNESYKNDELKVWTDDERIYVQFNDEKPQIYPNNTEGKSNANWRVNDYRQLMHEDDEDWMTNLTIIIDDEWKYNMRREREERREQEEFFRERINGR